MTQTIVSPDEFRRRIIEPAQFVADPAAFVDVRLPQSKGKESYSFIGAGVSQNAAQTINLSEPHGFNVGAAAMPNGVVNNPHLHFTAEIFICTRGRFRFTVGLGAEASSIEVGAGDILSVPTWVFRGFENIGPDDGWVFTCLGHDITGGIIWAPEVLAEAAETGLHLTADNRLVDTMAGESLDGVELARPMSTEDLAALPVYSESDLRTRLVRFDDLEWTAPSLLSSAAGAADVRLAPVIGRGMNEARGVVPPLTDYHGVSVEWIEVQPEAATQPHRVGVPQVLYLASGEWEIEVNGSGGAHDRLAHRPAPNSIVSLVPGSWRNLRNVGSEPATAVVATAGESKQAIEWHDDVVAAALRVDTARDANGYLAPAHLLPGGAS